MSILYPEEPTFLTIAKQNQIQNVYGELERRDRQVTPYLAQWYQKQGFQIDVAQNIYLYLA